MKSPSVPVRMGFVALASTALGVLGTLALFAQAGPAIGERTSVVIDRARSLDLAECAARPEDFAAHFADGLEVYAYDRALVSRRPTAPAIPLPLTERRRAGMDYPAELGVFGHWGGHMLLPGDASLTSPCHVLYARWPIDAGARATFLLESTLSMAVVLAATLGLLVWLVVRPLARRVDGLRRVAIRVDAAGNAAAEPRSELRDLGEIEGALERSIVRIDQHIADVEARRNAMERFLEDVAHDVRTPLSSVHLSVDELATHVTEGGAVDAIRRLTGDVVYLRNLFANLTTAARLRDGRAAHPRVFDLREVVARVAERARVLARRTGIELAVAAPGLPVRVRADEGWAEQALSNLVDNALLHGASGEHLAIRLGLMEGRFELRVLDDGPGVPDETLPRLGERTFRSDEARQRDPRGSGLGLAIVTEVCERSGWSLALERVEPRGLEARITGPTHEPDDEVEEEEKA